MSLRSWSICCLLILGVTASAADAAADAVFDKLRAARQDDVMGPERAKIAWDALGAQAHTAGFPVAAAWDEARLSAADPARALAEGPALVRLSWTLPNADAQGPTLRQALLRTYAAAGAALTGKETTDPARALADLAHAWVAAAAGPGAARAALERDVQAVANVIIQVLPAASPSSRQSLIWVLCALQPFGQAWQAELGDRLAASLPDGADAVTLASRWNGPLPAGLAPRIAAAWDAQAGDPRHRFAALAAAAAIDGGCAARGIRWFISDPSRCASQPGAEHFFAQAAVPADAAADWWRAALAGLTSDDAKDPRLALLAGLGLRRGPLPGMRIGEAERALLAVAVGRADPLRPALAVMVVAALAEPGRATADLDPIAAKALIALMPRPGQHSRNNDGATGALAILAMMERIRADGPERQALAAAGDTCKGWLKLAIRPLLIHSGIVAAANTGDGAVEQAAKWPEGVPLQLANAPLWKGAGELLTRTLDAVPAHRLDQLWDAILVRPDRALLAVLARPRLTRRLAEEGIALDERMAMLACLAVGGDAAAARQGLTQLDQVELGAVKAWSPSFDRLMLIDPAHAVVAATRARWVALAAGDPLAAMDLWLLSVRCGEKPAAFPRAAYQCLTAREQGMSTVAQITWMASDCVPWLADFADPVAALPSPDGALNASAGLAEAVARIRLQVPPPR